MAGRAFIGALGPDEEVELACLVRKRLQYVNKKGEPYLKLDLGDRSGHVDGYLWSHLEQYGPALAEGAIARVCGATQLYNGQLQLKVYEASALAEGEAEGLLADLFPASPRPLADMEAELWALVADINDADFRAITEAALKHPDVAGRFLLAPAAKSFHQAYLHGLLEHTVGVAALAKATAARYPQLNGSLLLAGALLHDVGKVWEFYAPPRFGYTTPGRLKGHLVIGAEFIDALGQSMAKFPADKLEALEHLILSHHGLPEYGAPVRPQLMEAMALHHLDNVDAKIAAMESALADGCDDEGWSGYQRLLECSVRRTPSWPAATLFG